VTDPRPFADAFEHLAAELEWLRVVVGLAVARARARPGDAPPALAVSDAEVDALLQSPLAAPRWELGEADPAALAELAGLADRLRAAVDRRRDAARAAGVALPLDVLAARCGLDDLERALLLIALAPDVDARFARLYGYLHDDLTRGAASVDLALGLLAGDLPGRAALRARLRPSAPLRRDGLLEPGDDALRLSAELRAAGRVLAAVHGDDELDPRLAHAARVVDPRVRGAAALGWSPGQAEQARRLAARGGRLHLRGPAGAGDRLAAEELAGLRGDALLVVDGPALAAEGPARLAELALALRREARLRGAAVLWTAADPLLADPAARRSVLDVLGHDVCAMFSGTEPWPGDDEPPTLELGRPLAPAAVWAAALAEAGAAVPPASQLAALVRAIPLGAGQIHAAAAARPADLHAAARAHSGRDLGALATRLEVRRGWDDLVLPGEPSALLRELVARVRLRDRVLDGWGLAGQVAGGRGVVALMCGPSGTGKTLAAGVLASELELDCYQIDLSTVVSKYIGETEKHLARLFAEAERTGAVLLFDEADALFGRRTGVQDAHDRYANLEVSYLLQRIDRYDGVVLLATNLRKNMDDAFVRRTHFVVEFPFPGPRERAAIWQRLLPPSLPLAPDVDPEWLAERFDLAGGHLRNIAVAAAFLAAADGGPLGREHLLRAARREYQNIGKVVDPRLFDRR
jgi:hypothetical protein